MEEDFYKILSVDPGAPREKIVEQVRRLSRFYSIGKQGIRGHKQNVMLSQIKRASEVLTDPIRRLEYDMHSGYKKHSVGQTRSEKIRYPPLKYSESIETLKTVRIPGQLDMDKLEKSLSSVRRASLGPKFEEEANANYRSLSRSTYKMSKTKKNPTDFKSIKHSEAGFRKNEFSEDISRTESPYKQEPVTLGSFQRSENEKLEEKSDISLELKADLESDRRTSPALEKSLSSVRRASDGHKFEEKANENYRSLSRSTHRMSKTKENPSDLKSIKHAEHDFRKNEFSEDISPTESPYNQKPVTLGSFQRSENEKLEEKSDISLELKADLESDRQTSPALEKSLSSVRRASDGHKFEEKANENYRSLSRSTHRMSKTKENPSDLKSIKHAEHDFRKNEFSEDISPTESPYNQEPVTLGSFQRSENEKLEEKSDISLELKADLESDRQTSPALEKSLSLVRRASAGHKFEEKANENYRSLSRSTHRMSKTKENASDFNSIKHAEDDFRKNEFSEDISPTESPYKQEPVTLGSFQRSENEKLEEKPDISLELKADLESDRQTSPALEKSLSSVRRASAGHKFEEKANENYRSLSRSTHSMSKTKENASDFNSIKHAEDDFRKNEFSEDISPTKSPYKQEPVTLGSFQRSENEKLEEKPDISLELKADLESDRQTSPALEKSLSSVRRGSAGHKFEEKANENYRSLSRSTHRMSKTKENPSDLKSIKHAEHDFRKNEFSEDISPTESPYNQEPVTLGRFQRSENEKLEEKSDISLELKADLESDQQTSPAKRARFLSVTVKVLSSHHKSKKMNGASETKSSDNKSGIGGYMTSLPFDVNDYTSDETSNKIGITVGTETEGEEKTSTKERKCDSSPSFLEVKSDLNNISDRQQKQLYDSERFSQVKRFPELSTARKPTYAEQTNELNLHKISDIKNEGTDEVIIRGDDFAEPIYLIDEEKMELSFANLKTETGSVIKIPNIIFPSKSSMFKNEEDHNLEKIISDDEDDDKSKKLHSVRSFTLNTLKSVKKLEEEPINNYETEVLKKKSFEIKRLMHKPSNEDCMHQLGEPLPLQLNKSQENQKKYPRLVLNQKCSAKKSYDIKRVDSIKQNGDICDHRDIPVKENSKNSNIDIKHVDSLLVTNSLLSRRQTEPILFSGTGEFHRNLSLPQEQRLKDYHSCRDFQNALQLLKTIRNISKDNKMICKSISNEETERICKDEWQDIQSDAREIHVLPTKINPPIKLKSQSEKSETKLLNEIILLVDCLKQKISDTDPEKCITQYHRKDFELITECKSNTEQVPSRESSDSGNKGEDKNDNVAENLETDCSKSKVKRSPENKPLGSVDSGTLEMEYPVYPEGQSSKSKIEQGGLLKKDSELQNNIELSQPHNKIYCSKSLLLDGEERRSHSEKLLNAFKVLETSKKLSSSKDTVHEESSKENKLDTVVSDCQFKPDANYTNTTQIHSHFPVGKAIPKQSIEHFKERSDICLTDSGHSEHNRTESIRSHKISLKVNSNGENKIELVADIPVESKPEIEFLESNEPHSSKNEVKEDPTASDNIFISTEKTISKPCLNKQAKSDQDKSQFQKENLTDIFDDEDSVLNADFSVKPNEKNTLKVWSRDPMSSEEDDEEPRLQNVSATTRIAGANIRTVYNFGPNTEFIEVFVNDDLKAKIVKGEKQDIYCNAMKHDDLPEGVQIFASTVIAANDCIITTEVSKREKRETIVVYKNDEILFRSGNTVLD